MAGLLPTAYQTGFNNGYPVLFVVRIQLTSNDNLTVASQPNMNFSYGGISLAPDYEYVRSSDSGAYLAAEIDGADVEGIGEIDLQMNIQDGGGLAAVGECGVVFLNQARFDDFISQFDIENRRIEIWEGYDPPGHAVAIDTDMFLKFRGVIRDASTWDYQRFMIPCVDRRELDNVLIPANKISAEVFPGAPKAVIGKVVPIVVGDFKTYNETLDGNIIPYMGGKFNSPPTLLIDDKNYYLLACDHPVTMDTENCFLITNNDDWIAKLFPDSLAIDTEPYFNSGGSRIRVLLDARCNVITIPKIAWVDNNVDDVSPVGDGDESTYVSLSFGSVLCVTPAQSPSPSTLLFTVFVPISHSAELVISYEDCVGAVPVSFIEKDSVTPHSLGNLSLTSGIEHFYFNLPSEFNWEDVLNQAYKIVPGVGQSVKIKSMYVNVEALANPAHYETKLVGGNKGNVLGQGYQRGVEQKSFVPGVVTSSIYPSLKGVKYGTWINGRGTGFVAGDTIEQPAYFIEYLLRERLGIVDAQIDMTSFDDVGNSGDGTRKDYKIAASILQEREGFEHIRQICSEFVLQLLLTNRGVYKLVSLDQTPAGTATTFTATSNYIMFEDGVPQIQVRKTSIDKVKNEFFLNYRMNYATSHMERERHISLNLVSNMSDTGGAPRGGDYGVWLSDSGSRYGKRVSYVADLDYVRDDATAELILKTLADWLAFKRLVVSMKLKRNLTTMLLEVGDKIMVQNDLLGNISSGTVNFIITKLNYPPVSKSMEPYLNIECEEIPNQYTGLTQIKKLSDPILGEQ